jgi:hypothetical protein
LGGDVIRGLRLWHLAEGNPDEEKIGAFGVGRYQLTAMISALTPYFFGQVSTVYFLSPKNLW